MAQAFEIERRYLIRFPDLEALEKEAEKTEIEQTYLLPDGDWHTNRLRKRGRDGAYTYTHTRKQRLSALRRLEDEREISREEYETLLLRADPSYHVIHKFRYCYCYEGQLFELDVFSFWQDRAILEIELKEEQQTVLLPPQFEIIREISADNRYTNAALAREIPREEI